MELGRLRGFGFAMPGLGLPYGAGGAWQAPPSAMHELAAAAKGHAGMCAVVVGCSPFGGALPDPEVVGVARAHEWTVLGDGATHTRLASGAPVRLLTRNAADDEDGEAAAAALQERLSGCMNLERQFHEKFVVATTAAADGELPEREAVAWAHVLVQEVGESINSLDELEAVVALTVRPSLASAAAKLAAIGNGSGHLDWWRLYTRSLDGAVDAFREALAPLAAEDAARRTAALDALVPGLAHGAPTLQDRAVRVALAAGVDVVLTEDPVCGGRIPAGLDLAELRAAAPEP